MTTDNLALYMFNSCPYCVRVLDAMKRLNLTLELRNTHKNDAFRNELVAGGGKSQVPCLRIENADGSVQWLYESLDIISYLEKAVRPS